MNYNEKKVEAVKDFLMGLDDNDIFSIYDEYADECGYERIFENSDDLLNEIFNSPSDAIRAVCFSDYNYNDDYVMFDGNGNLESSNYLQDMIDFDELTDWVIRNDPREIHSELENTLQDEFSELFKAEHTDDDMTSYLYSHDIIGEDWNDLIIEIEDELKSDSDDEE